MKKSFTPKHNRRQFLDLSIKTSAALPLLSSPLFTSLANSKKESRNIPAPLKILILGGTSFLGPHQIAYALGRGHSITTFTRGKTQPTIYKELFKDVEQLIGDREDNLEALKGKKWDAVIDNSGRKVEWAKATAELLKDTVGMYLFTSTVSVYYPYYKADLKEDARLVLEMPEVIEDEGEKRSYDYGIMKAQSELAVEKVFGKDRTTVVRPTFMCGPADRTDRFMFWPISLAKGGDVILPGRDNDPVQHIDVRDIADWMIRLIENKTSGTFNGVGPASASTIPAFVYGAHAAFGSAINFVRIDNYDFLEEQNLGHQLPWIKESEKYYGISRVNNQHSIANGLTFRPLATTVRDSHDWWYSDAVTQERRDNFMNDENGLIKRQENIIKAWHNRS